MVGRQMQQWPGLLKQRDSQYLKGWYFEDEMLFPGRVAPFQGSYIVGALGWGAQVQRGLLKMETTLNNNASKNTLVACPKKGSMDYTEWRDNLKSFTFEVYLLSKDRPLFFPPVLPANHKWYQSFTLFAITQCLLSFFLDGGISTPHIFDVSCFCASARLAGSKILWSPQTWIILMTHCSNSHPSGVSCSSFLPFLPHSSLRGTSVCGWCDWNMIPFFRAFCSCFSIFSVTRR